MDIRTYIKDHILLFDGGMGTYFASKSGLFGAGCELAVLNQPDLIRQIHKEYIEAGARAIKTNTFAANRINFQGDEELTLKVLERAWRVANEAALSSGAYVFADIGPVSGDFDAGEEYCFLAEQFLRLGARHFLFETNASAEGLTKAAEYIRSRVPEAFIMVSFAVLPDGYTRDGIYTEKLIREVRSSGMFDVFGLNCVTGGHDMLKQIRGLDQRDILLAAMPNAGYPIVIQNRTFYSGEPEYFAEKVCDLIGEGVRIVGGCCGTTPDHIRCVSERLQAVPEKVPFEACRRQTEGEDSSNRSADKCAETREASSKAERDAVYSPFWNKLTAGEKVVAVELDPPAGADLSKFMSGAWQLKGAGVDVITIADCPVARARMDAGILACKIHRELGIDALPHLTCRDRNLNATKALILGVHAEGIRNMLLITGDPIPTAERDEVRSVYQFNSRKLAAFVSEFAEKNLPGELHLFGALNVNARNFDIQLKLAKEKEENGMVGFLTQPVLTERALENLKRARRELKGYILGGIMPVVSEKNARFMDREVNGIDVDPRIIELYVGKNRSEGEALAVRISCEIAAKMSDYVDGYYIVTPFGRCGVVTEILKGISF